MARKLSVDKYLILFILGTYQYLEDYNDREEILESFKILS